MEFASQSGQNTALPQPFEQVIAETPQGRCVGYVDARGRWLRVVNGTLMPEVVSWYPICTRPVVRPRPVEPEMVEPDLPAEPSAPAA